MNTPTFIHRHIKRNHSDYQRIFANGFFILFAVLFVQLIAIVYAMSFSLSSSTAETHSTLQIFLGDFDGDGDLDNVALNTVGGANSYDTYTNDGTGTFINGTFGSATALRNGRVRDIDGDGDLDIMTLNDNGSTIMKYINNGSASFTEYTVAFGLTDDKRDIELVDMDSDGDLDLMTIGDAAVANGVFLNNGHGVFTTVASSLPGANYLTAADFDSDGDMDLAMINGVGDILVYTNSGTGAFIQLSTTTGAPGIHDIISGDLDGDGDIDILGNGTGLSSHPYLNNGLGTTMAAGTPFGPAIVGSSYKNALGDIDNDGDLDAIVVSGTTNGGNFTFLNNGSAAFTQSGTPTEVSDDTRMAALGDIDGDFDLDYISANNGDPNRHYKSDQAATSANTAPTAPVSLTGAIISDDGSVATVRLSWGSGSDTQTATRLLQYQVRVGTGSSAHNIVSGRTSSPGWVTRMMPNGQSRTMVLKNLPCRTGLTYYWTVSTVDTGYRSTAAVQQTFTIDNGCTFAVGGGGGGGGGSSTTTSGGGGLSARYWSHRKKVPVLSGTGQITVTAYDDLDGNGVKSARERALFKGLPVTASGRTLLDGIVRTTLTIDERGQAVFILPPSDTRGYWLTVDTGSVVLRGYEPTTTTSTGGIVLTPTTTADVAFGFQRTDLLRYAPCLSVGPAPKNERSGTDAEVLLQRLHDPFGRTVMRGMERNDGLITRREFFLLLQRTQCIDLIRDRDVLQQQFRAAAKKLKISLPFIDLSMDLTLPDSLLVHSLLAAGVDTGRSTRIGDAADLTSPITREEALRAVLTVLNVPAHKRSLAGLPPNDLKADDLLTPEFLTLQNLGVLPESFRPIFGRSQGLRNEETATLLARAAFAGGKIFLENESTNVKKLKSAATTPTFLVDLPVLRLPSCLMKNPDRSGSITFSDLLPGDALFSPLRELLSYGTVNRAKQTLWLLPGTTRPTEFGIVKGQTKAALAEPVSILETIRSLLVLSCTPPNPAIDVQSGKTKLQIIQGSAESRVPRDRISALDRDASFASRVLFRAQDHQKEFDLSLFTYAPEMLRKDSRSPASGLTVDEAASMLASGLLMMHVQARTMSPQDAEKRSRQLTLDITRDLLETDIDWHDAPLVKTIPFTRRMLLQFFATVVTGHAPIESASVPLGEVWWERVR